MPTCYVTGLQFSPALFTSTVLLFRQGCSQKDEAAQSLDVRPTRQKNDQIIINVQEVLTIYSFTAHTAPTHVVQIKGIKHGAEQISGNQ